MKASEAIELTYSARNKSFEMIFGIINQVAKNGLTDIYLSREDCPYQDIQYTIENLTRLGYKCKEFNDPYSGPTLFITWKEKM